ncbi:hypothetical protein LCGC14_2610230, partial [marine sediment metagenome]
FILKGSGTHRLSRSMRDGIAGESNSGFGAVSLAHCLGANPIYLLGFDMKGKSGRQSWWHKGYPSNQRGDVYKVFINDFKRIVPELEKRGTKNRIKAKTAWDADSLRGDYADLLIFDEWQLTSEDAWDDVGVPMLLDNDGDAVFIYTPPSLKSSGISRARDPLHAKKMFEKAREDRTGRWAAFHFSSHENPFISEVALQDITQDMSRDSYLKEIMAEDDEGQVNLLVYGCFDEKICKIPREEIPEKWILYTGHDFGTANPAALFIAQDPGTGFFYCFNEYVPIVGKSTYQNVQAFKEIAGEKSIRSRVGGSHQEEEIRQGYGAQGWPITEPFILKVNSQIDRVKQLMEKNKIFIFDDMYRLLEQINSCMWKLDDMGKPTNAIKDEKKYHLLACLRYVCSIFRPEREEVEKKNVVLQVIR